MASVHPVVLKLLRLLGHQDWLRYGIRIRIIRSVCNPKNVASHEFQVDFYGFKYNGNLSCYVDWVVYFFGAYEKYDLLLLKDLVKRKVRPVFIDVGANVGHHSVFMSPHCDIIHAFEPYEPARKRLEQKIQANNIANIVVHGVGLGDRDSELDFFAPSGHNTGCGTFVEGAAAGDGREARKLQVVNGDSYLARLGVGQVDLVKIDVEGFEENVLLGLRNTLIKYRPVVVMECSGVTQQGFQVGKEIRSLLPEQYSVRAIRTYVPYGGIFNRRGYHIAAFRGDVSDCNIVCWPSEEGRVQ